MKRARTRWPSTSAALALLFSLAPACGDSADPWREPMGSDTEQTGSAAEGNGGSDGGSSSGSSEPVASSDGGGGAAANDAGTMSAGQDSSAQKPDAAPAPPPPPPTPTEYETAKSLVGSYAAVIKYRDVITVGIAGTGSLVTTVLATAEIKDDTASKSVRLGMSLCEARIGAMTKHLLDLDMTIPKSALSAATVEPVTLRAKREGDKVTWKADELRGVAGWKAASASDALPKRDDDPRLVDQDGDGKPGVTGTFTGHAMGTVFLALDYHFVLSGGVETNGDLSGTTTSTSREGLLGSSELLLLGATIERMADPEVADNTVRLVKQSAPLTCDALLAVRDTLPR